MTQGRPEIVSELEPLLRLRSITFAMKMFERGEDMEAIERSEAT